LLALVNVLRWSMKYTLVFSHLRFVDRTPGCTSTWNRGSRRTCFLTTRTLTVLRLHFLVLLMLWSDPATNLHCPALSLGAKRLSCQCCAGVSWQLISCTRL
jgi:hypothetical protein